MKTIILLGLTAILGTTAFAAPDDGGDRRADRGALLRIAAREFRTFREETPLSDAQRAELKTILKSHKPGITGQMEKARDARRAMRRAVEAHGPDSAEARKAADDIAGTARERALLAGKIGSEIRPILTTEQKELAKASRERIEESVDQRFSGRAR